MSGVDRLIRTLAKPVGYPPIVVGSGNLISIPTAPFRPFYSGGVPRGPAGKHEGAAVGSVNRPSPGRPATTRMRRKRPSVQPRS